MVLEITFPLPHLTTISIGFQYKKKNTAEEVQTSDPIKKSLGKHKITGEAKTWTVNEMLASETIATANIHTA